MSALYLLLFRAVSAWAMSLRGVARFFCAFAALAPLLSSAAPLPYVDPPGYPTTWPGQLGVQAYTRQGRIQSDWSASYSGSGPDPSKNATPQGAVDFSGGSQNLSSIFFYGSGSVLYIRVRVAGPPQSLSGAGQPFISATWNFLLDTDGDGFKEFVIELDGTDGSAAPDDLVTLYDNSNSQQFAIGAANIWRQDSARHPANRSGDNTSGEPGSAVDWDKDADPFVWDFGRTRVVQIDTAKPSGSQNSEYFLDIQVPLAALDASAWGGPTLQASSFFSIIPTTSNSNTDPTQKDLLFEGDFTLANAPLPGGDLANASGQIIQAPIITRVTATACPSPILLSATVLDATTVTNGVTSDTLRTVRFQSYWDLNHDGAANDGLDWTALSDATRTATLGLWTVSWASSALPKGSYLIRAVAVDTQDNTTVSTEQPLAFPSGVFATFDNQCGLAGATVTGQVYADANRNALLDSEETGAALPLYVKLVTESNPGGPAFRAAIVNASSGTYILPGVTNGAYLLLLDDNGTLSDVSPTLPSGWLGTEAPAQVRALWVNNVDVARQNFGLIRAGLITGVVFRDDGSGGAIANDGLRAGVEAGLSGSLIQLTDQSGASVFDSTITDGSGRFRLLVPSAVTSGTPLRIVQRNLSAHVSTGASLGNSGGSYDRLQDGIHFTYNSSLALAGLAFGDVPENQFTTDGQQAGLPGSVIWYSHGFVAGTAGQVLFAVENATSPPLSGWSQILYRDQNCNLQLDAGEPAIAGPITLAAGEKICLLLKDFIPANAPYNAQNRTLLTATFQFAQASPALSSTSSRVDLTVVGTPTSAGLTLLKRVDKAAAAPGETITYTITYQNQSSGPLSDVVISDSTPIFTQFVRAEAGALGAGFAAVAIESPAAGTRGAVRWTFQGALASGAQGTVQFSVRVE